MEGKIRQVTQTPHWVSAKVKQCFKFRNGKGFSGVLKSIPDEEYCYPVYGGNGIMGYSDKYLLEEPTIIVGRVGEYCGNVFKTQEKSWVTDNAMMVYDVLLEDYDVDFWTAMLNSLSFNHYSDSTGQPKITQGGIGAISFKYPSEKTEQTAIANILSKVDEAISSVQNSIAVAERLKKSLMQNLLTGKMKPDGTFRTPEEFYIDKKFGKVPVGWHWGRLSEIADIIAGQSPQGEYYNVNGAGKPMLNGPTEFTDKYPMPVQWTTKITKLCKKGDILFTVRGSSTGRMNLADQEYCIGRGLAAIRPKSNNNISFIYYTLLKISEMILAEAKGAGTTFPNVSRGELMKKVILIPDTRQNEIIAPIEQLARFSDSKQRSIDKLEILKKSLMQNLLTGKVYINSKILNI